VAVLGVVPTHPAILGPTANVKFNHVNAERIDRSDMAL
jgi:hypothetical protein